MALCPYLTNADGPLAVVVSVPLTSSKDEDCESFPSTSWLTTAISSGIFIPCGNDGELENSRSVLVTRTLPSFLQLSSYSKERSRP
jgi:hypothetical protein